jgi:uncharacterized membrane protein YedE/YeeE
MVRNIMSRDSAALPAASTLPAAALLRVLAAALCGLLFGAGLTVSGMTDPVRVLGFLDVAGAWDPTLALVMAGALAVAAPGMALVRRRGAPLLAPRLLIPTRRDIDAPLLAGAVLFGVGWGLVGLCPGPALANLSTGLVEVAMFVAAMAVGLAVGRRR